MTCTEERFLSDVRNHELTIVRDDGLYRHIRLSRRRSYAYGFDILTWPGRLCLCGDMGTFVFARLPDMFEFFRNEPCERGGLVPINPDYWAEKLEAPKGGRRDGEAVWRWDHERFKECVTEDMEAFIEHNMEGFSDDAARLREEVRDEVLEGDESEFDAMHAVNAFSFEYDHERQRFCAIRKRLVSWPRTFRFEDFYEHNCHSYTFHYLWACRAIVWGIQQYDARTVPWYKLPVGACRKRSPVWLRTKKKPGE